MTCGIPTLAIVFGSAILAANSLQAQAITDTGTQVGIGTSSPGAKLEVESASGYGTTAPLFMLDGRGSGLDNTALVRAYSSGSLNRFTYITMDPDSNNFSIDRNGANQKSDFVINGSGNVGLGTTAPTSALSVAGNIDLGGALPSDVWGQVIGFGSSGAYGTTQGIIGHQGSHHLDLYWNFYRSLDSGGTIYKSANAYGYTSANGISLGDSGIEMRATSAMGSTLPPVQLLVTNGGYVGVGTTSPAARLSLDGFTPPVGSVWGADDTLLFHNGSLGDNGSNGQWWRWNVYREGGTANYRYLDYLDQANAADIVMSTTGIALRTVSYSGSAGDVVSLPTRMIITPDGNIGMGTMNPGSNKLAVNGTIKAKEVIVETSGWSDDVFAPSFTLRSLQDTKAYIQTNGHLPDVPSAEEVAQSGVNVGSMQATLLRKVEELTLHVITLEEEVAALKAANAKLAERASD